MTDNIIRLHDRNIAEDDRPKAAMYLRMSTDMQQYSTENQEAAIREYAKQNEIEIITTYCDDGRSGLNIEDRPEMRRLLADVNAGAANFELILVLDITRWGRFQNTIEGAVYEYECNKAGIKVIYVAEPFINDSDNIFTGVVKEIKRSQSAGYSLELSGKVHRGQCRLIKEGFRQGGMAGFGLRRMMIDEHRNEKTLLLAGQRKSFQTDRVILVPGPQEEIKVVREVYNMFIHEGISEREIAGRLNNRGIKTDLGRDWTRGTVHQILTNEKYIGNNVFNRTSCKLKQKTVKNPEELWVRAESAFEAIIDPSMFYNAQGIIRARSFRLSDEDMLVKLRSLHDKRGMLSGLIIDEADDMPSSSAYQHRFGSLIEAYKLIGYDPGRDYRYIEINKHLRTLYPQIVEDTIRKIQAMGGDVHREVGNDLIYVNDNLKVSIVICRCFRTEAGKNRWKVHFDTGLSPDITIAIRMDINNEHPLDYYILPAIDIENPDIRLADHNGLALDSYRFRKLEPFFVLTKQVRIPEAA